MLDRFYNSKDFESCLVSPGKFCPFPRGTERSKWDGIDERQKRELISKAEEYLGFDWPILPAVRYMDYGRDGNRSRYENAYFERRVILRALVAAECAEGSGRFIDDVINGIWAICEETAWWVPAHRLLSPAQENEVLPDPTDPILDLFAIETASLLAWTHYLLKGSLDRVSRRVCERIEREIKGRIMDPYLNRDDFFWMGLRGNERQGNWTTWCTSNAISVFLLLEKDAARLNAAIKKAMRCLDVFLDSYPEDGGCEEGCTYWEHAGGSLFESLELLYLASDGAINVFGEPKIKEIGRCILKLHISGDYFINFGDGRARLSLPAELVYRYGLKVRDPQLAAFGQALCHRTQTEKLFEKRHETLFQILSGVFGPKAEEGVQGFCFTQDMYIESLQLMAAREQDGTDRGFYLAVKGGHNGQFHNHNDVGTFYVFHNGLPLFIDAGVGHYMAKHSSTGMERYTIWTQRSSYHNLPTINGFEQMPGDEFTACEVHYHSDDACAEISMDIAKAYPEEAGIEYWNRAFRFERAKRAEILVTEDFKLRQPACDTYLSLLAAIEPQIYADGRIVFDAADGSKILAVFDANVLSADAERIPIDDERLMHSWGDCLWRILLRVKPAQISEGRLELRITRM